MEFLAKESLKARIVACGREGIRKSIRFKLEKFLVVKEISEMTKSEIVKLIQDENCKITLPTGMYKSGALANCSQFNVSTFYIDLCQGVHIHDEEVLKNLEMGTFNILVKTRIQMALRQLRDLIDEALEVVKV